ncbi:DUF4748 domain-containing protein [Aspergillus ruber CBS 135680]|uniref:Uncharacterized protein n=1 Tax=Aspergillus ruber (strain CBS 135680) TaxID=1388766 RepID=A0A017SJR5_ASPRC|nr:uncharacterized protein EURHEDRAFT_342133 [Aspergillus ruber CBS 135680]EYE96909.1 hypothetical protein EURHEDRAFT_342133 [Aspergillus ruber CBS 135680]
MNTIRSTWLGWGVLCIAGGGAYIGARKSIDADRVSKHDALMKHKAQMAAMARAHDSSSSNSHKTRTKGAENAVEPPIRNRDQTRRDNLVRENTSGV